MIESGVEVSEETKKTLAAMKASTQREPTPDERRAQTVSFVIGMLGDTSAETRKFVEAEVRKMM